MVDINQAKVDEITDSQGAVDILSRRFNKPFSIHSLHQLVKQGKIRAFIFQNGRLEERTEEVHTRGKDLLFFKPDVWNVSEPKVGKPKQIN